MLSYFTVHSRKIKMSSKKVFNTFENLYYISGKSDRVSKININGKYEFF